MRPDGAGVVALQPHGQQQQALNILARMDPPGSSNPTPANPTPANPSPAATLRPVHGAALQRTLDRLSRSRSAPWLHAEVARRMAERLGVIKLKPRVVLDWEARLGGGGSALRAAYADDGVRPEGLDYYLKITGMTEEEFFSTLEKHRRPELARTVIPIYPKPARNEEELLPYPQQLQRRFQSAREG